MQTVLFIFVGWIGRRMRRTDRRVSLKRNFVFRLNHLCRSTESGIRVSDHGRAAFHKVLRLAALEQCEKLYVVRLYTTFDEARAKARTSAPEIENEGPRTLEEEEAALEHFIDSAGPTEVPIEARCIRGNTGYAVLDFAQSVGAMMLAVPDSPEIAGLPAHIEWVTDVIPCNLWVIR